ncbi:MAG TPA: hypothetical protein VEG30_14475 [Terriglobales bacterium]|nr:hypothetical protein [Terriglobales bacterium]
MIDTGGSKPTETYQWLCADQQCKVLECFISKWNSQSVCSLWEVNQLSAAHDAQLAEATKRINAIISRLDKGNKDRNRKLSFVQFQNRHLLVWARYGAVGPNDDPKKVIKALGLKVPKRRK